MYDFNQLFNIQFTSFLFSRCTYPFQITAKGLKAFTRKNALMVNHLVTKNQLMGQSINKIFDCLILSELSALRKKQTFVTVCMSECWERARQALFVALWNVVHVYILSVAKPSPSRLEDDGSKLSGRWVFTGPHGDGVEWAIHRLCEGLSLINFMVHFVQLLGRCLAVDPSWPSILSLLAQLHTSPRNIYYSSRATHWN